MRLRQRAAEDREILGEDEDRAAIDSAPAGHHAIAGDPALLHAEIVGAVFDEHAELLEGPLVENEIDALARGQLATLVLRLDPGLPATLAGDVTAAFELFENFLQGDLPLRRAYSEPGLSVKIDRIRAAMFSARISSDASERFERLSTSNVDTAITVPSSTEAASTVIFAELWLLS